MKPSLEIFELLVAVRKGVKPVTEVRRELEQKVSTAQTNLQGPRLTRFDVFADEADAFLRLCEIQHCVANQQATQPNKWQLFFSAPLSPQLDSSGLDLWLACLQNRAEQV